ncbi:MAG: ATP-binding cassette domain-containing protein [Candidatus Marsarchaeota archaeon]|nr:ATP-binding cassette domain-containing protein [Candidatus Marsarchaeota archaeon]
MKYVIEVSDLHKNFETYEPRSTGIFRSLRRVYKTKRALRGVNMSVRQGEILALLGRNGSGKSTLIKTITGILHPDSGRVRAMGLDPWKERKKLAMQIGVVFGSTHPQLYWDLPPIDTFKYIKGVYGISDDDYKKRLKYFIELLSLKKVYKRQARQLSLGERMKCEMVAALLHLPPLVIMDEPTIGMDLPARVGIRRAVLKLRKDYGMTFLITTHVVDDVANVDRIVMLDEGKVIFDGSQERMRNMLAKNLTLELRFGVEENPKRLIIHGTLIKYKPGYAKVEIKPRELKEAWLSRLITSSKIIDYRISEPSLSTVLERFYSASGKGKHRSTEGAYDDE